MPLDDARRQLASQPVQRGSSHPILEPRQRRLRPQRPARYRVPHHQQLVHSGRRRAGRRRCQRGDQRRCRRRAARSAPRACAGSSHARACRPGTARTPSPQAVGRVEQNGAASGASLRAIESGEQRLVARVSHRQLKVGSDTLASDTHVTLPSASRQARRPLRRDAPSAFRDTDNQGCGDSASPPPGTSPPPIAPPSPRSTSDSPDSCAAPATTHTGPASGCPRRPPASTPPAASHAPARAAPSADGPVRSGAYQPVAKVVDPAWPRRGRVSYTERHGDGQETGGATGVSDVGGNGGPSEE